MDIYLVYSFVSWHFFASTSVSYCLRFAPTPLLSYACVAYIHDVWPGGVVGRALDLRLEIADSILAAALSSATLDKSLTHICLCHQAA